MMRWSERETCQFVRIYLTHECLWNPQNPFYKLKDKRHKEYKEMILQFKEATGISLNECELRSKIKNLRSTYVQEVAKIRKRSNSDSEYKPTIKWFNPWHKCFQRFSRKRPDGDLQFDQEQEEPTDDTCQKIWLEQDTDNADDEAHSDPDPFESQNDNDYLLFLKSEPNDTSHITDEHTESTYKIKKKKFNHNRQGSENLNGSYRNSTDTYSDLVLREDEFDIYGKYIASQLRKMDLQRALRLQLEIQSLVSEARISETQSDNH